MLIFLVLVLMIALGFDFSWFDNDACFAAVIFVVVLVIRWTVKTSVAKDEANILETAAAVEETKWYSLDLHLIRAALSSSPLRCHRALRYLCFSVGLHV